MSRRRTATLALSGGVLLAASYPPLAVPALSFVALAPAIILLREAVTAGDPRRAFHHGFWYGAAAHGLVLYWIIVALWHFTRASALAYLATICVLALWSGALFWLVARACLRFPRLPLWAVVPVVWTAVEWAIGHQGDVRFPWLGLGTSLADAPILVQWADLAGARGVTLWVVWCNVMIVEAWRGMGEGGWGTRGFRWRPVLAVLGSVLLAFGYGAWRMRTIPVRELGPVLLIQPNEQEKWERPADTVFGHVLGMTVRALRASGASDLVIWPEAAIPDYLFRHPDWEERLAAIARTQRVHVLVGGVHADFAARSAGRIPYYNAAWYYDSTGASAPYEVYGKRYLVPIVERVPFVPPEWFGNLRYFGGFSRGQALPLYPSPLGLFGVIICYESAFEDLPRAYRRRGADFLVNITNDMWFGRTSAPSQHSSHLVLRAIETRMGVARAANSGISQFVDPLGRAYASTGLEQEAIVVDRVRTSDVVTPYVRLGDWVGMLAVIATLGFSIVLAVDAWRSRRPQP